MLNPAAGVRRPVYTIKGLTKVYRTGELTVHALRGVDGRARLTGVSIDHRDSDNAEVTKGLSPGDVVVLHPSDEVTDGVRVEPRDLN